MEWCRFLMGLWVWLRSVNVWSTFFLSAFHFQTLRRITPIAGNKGPSKILFVIFGLIWIINLLYSIPAYMFSTNGDKNATEVNSQCPVCPPHHTNKHTE